MSVEQSQKKHLEELKEQEKKAAEQDMYETFATLQKDNNKEATSKDSDIWTEQDTNNVAPSGHSGSAPTTKDSSQQKKAHGDDDAEEEYIPPPRSLRQGGKAKVTVNFSERPFPTPLRDSRKGKIFVSG